MARVDLRDTSDDFEIDHSVNEVRVRARGRADSTVTLVTEYWHRRDTEQQIVSSVTPGNKDAGYI